MTWSSRPARDVGGESIPTWTAKTARCGLLLAAIAVGSEALADTGTPAPAASPPPADAIHPGTPAPAASPPPAARPFALRPPSGRERAIYPRSFRLVESQSGPVNYYTVVDDPDGGYIHSSYQPPYETSVLAWAVPEKLRRQVGRIRWRWRAVTLPRGGDECAEGMTDSAAVVYLTWKRGLRWYTLKYVWSAVGPKGAVCSGKRNLFQAQDTIVVESGGPLGEWRTVDLDPDAEFRKHFESGDPTADVPPLGGVGLMSDGDQTQSPSEADFGGFVITYR